MQQQVNLYIEPEAPREILLDTKNMLKFSSFFLLLLLVVTVVIFGIQYQKQTQLENLEATKKNLNENLARSKSSLSTEQERKRLTEQLEQKQMTRQSRQRMFSTLSNLHYGQHKGFSTYLNVLSKHGVQGIWLTQVIFDAGGEYIFLEGRTFKAQLVPELLQALGQDKEFKGKSFEQLQLSTTEEGEYLQFTLESKK